MSFNFFSFNTVLVVNVYNYVKNDIYRNPWSPPHQEYRTVSVLLHRLPSLLNTLDILSLPRLLGRGQPRPPPPRPALHPNTPMGRDKGRELWAGQREKREMCPRAGRGMSQCVCVRDPGITDRITSLVHLTQRESKLSPHFPSLALSSQLPLAYI